MASVVDFTVSLDGLREPGADTIQIVIDTLKANLATDDTRTEWIAFNAVFSEIVYFAVICRNNRSARRSARMPSASWPPKYMKWLKLVFNVLFITHPYTLHSLYGHVRLFVHDDVIVADKPMLAY